MKALPACRYGCFPRPQTGKAVSALMLDSVGAATVATFWRLARREAVLNQHLQKARTPAIASGKVASRKHLIGERPVAVTSCRRCGRIEGESYAASEWVSGTPAAETAVEATARAAVTFAGDANRRGAVRPRTAALKASTSLGPVLQWWRPIPNGE